MMDTQLERLIHALVQIGKGNKWLKYPIMALLFVMAGIYDCFCLMGELLRPKMRRRILASVLSACMVFTLLPVTAFAAEPVLGVSILCEHHTEHTQECGYIEAVEGAPCGFVPDAPEEASPSDTVEPETEPTAHVHNVECGYIETVEGTPCGFVCEICRAGEEEPTAEEPTAEEPTCVCTEACGEYAVNVECPACTEDRSVCEKMPLPFAAPKAGETTWEIGSATAADVTATLSGGILTIEGNGDMADFSNSNPVPWDSLVSEITSVTVSSGVTSIGYYAFINFTNSTSVTLHFSDQNPEKFISPQAFPSNFTAGNITVIAEDASPKIFKGWSSTGLGVATFTDSTAATTTLTKTVDQADIIAEYDTPATETTWDIGAPTATDITATLSADKTTLAITGTGAMEDWVSSNKVPWNADSASITTVTIGDGVTNIGNYAFIKCSALTSISVPDGVTKIGVSAFEECTKLTAITIPESVTEIRGYAFKTTGLTSIAIPEGMTTIGDWAFRSCTALTSVTIPESMTSIGVGAFKECGKLASVTMNFNDTKVKTIDTAAFDLIKNGATLSVAAKDASPKTFKTWSSTAKSGGTAATFTDATTAGTTLTNVPSNCTITAEYEAPVAEAQWTVDSEPKTGTFAAALEAMKANGGSIKLLTAVDTASYTALPAQAIALDFNGQTWTSGGAIQVVSGGTLTVTGTGGGGITAATTTGVTVQSGGTLDLRSGSITCTASGFSGISNSGTLKLSGGTVTSTLASAIANIANGTIYLSGAPTITSASQRMGINCAAGTTVIANDGNVSSPGYSTGAVSIQVPSKSIAGYVAVTGLKDADHAKKFTLGNVPAGLVFFYDDSTKSIKLATAPENAEVPTITKDLSTTQVVYTVGGKAAALDATATVTDGGTITYDWYSNATNSTTGGTKLKVTTATYTPPTTTAGTTYYYCVVKNTNSAATNKTATTTSAVANIKVEAAAESYGIYVGDTLIDANNKSDVLGNGTATYNSDTNTLTLNGITINDDNKCFNDYDSSYTGIFSVSDATTTVVP